MRSLVLGVVLLGWGGEALGQAGDPAVEERRTRLFKEGKALSDEGKWGEAAAKFQEVVAIRPAAKAHLALAVAERNAGKLVAARRAAMAAAELARGGGAEQKEELAAAEESLRSTDARIAGVRLELPVGMSPEILVDDKPGLVERGVLFLDPGTHRIEVREPGRVPFKSEVTVGEGERRTLSVVMPAAGAKGGAETPPPAAGGGGVPVGPIVLLVGGVAAAGGGMALWATGTGAINDAYKQCAQPVSEGAARVCPAGLKPTIDGGAAQVYAGDVLVGVGAAAAVGGGIWLFVSRRSAVLAAHNVFNRVTLTGLAGAPLPGGGVVQVSGAF